MLKARAGNMAEAQAALRAMLAAGTDDGLVAMDLTTLLQQDGKSSEAVAVFEKAASPSRRTMPCSPRRGPIATYGATPTLIVWPARACGASPMTLSGR